MGKIAKRQYGERCGRGTGHPKTVKLPVTQHGEKRDEEDDATGGRHGSKGDAQPSCWDAGFRSEPEPPGPRGPGSRVFDRGKISFSPIPSHCGAPQSFPPSGLRENSSVVSVGRHLFTVFPLQHSRGKSVSRFGDGLDVLQTALFLRQRATQRRDADSQVRILDKASRPHRFEYLVFRDQPPVVRRPGKPAIRKSSGDERNG